MCYSVPKMSIVALFYQELTRGGSFYPPPSLYCPKKSPSRLGLQVTLASLWNFSKLLYEKWFCVISVELFKYLMK